MARVAPGVGNVAWEGYARSADHLGGPRDPQAGPVRPAAESGNGRPYRRQGSVSQSIKHPCVRFYQARPDVGGCLRGGPDKATRSVLDGSRTGTNTPGRGMSNWRAQQIHGGIYVDQTTKLDQKVSKIPTELTDSQHIILQIGPVRQDTPTIKAQEATTLVASPRGSTAV